MTIKCKACGFEDSKAAFKYLGLAESAGPNCYRLCPRCQAAVYCDELDLDYGKARPGEEIWGTGPLRGRIFTLKDKKSFR